MLGLAKPVRTFETNPAALGGGLGGAVAGSGKLGTIARKAPLPVAIVAASGIALKAFYDWNHKGDKNPLEHAISGGKMGDVARNLFGDPKADELERAAKAYQGINDATKKLPNQLDLGRTAGQKLRDELFKIDKADPVVDYRAPGFDALFQRTRDYKSILDGLERTYTTVIRTRYEKNDIGDGAGSVPAAEP